jgi:multiple sugar transport system permease protein
MTTFERPTKAMTTKSRKIKPVRGIYRILLYVSLSILSLLSIAPFAWMIFGSVKSGAEIRSIPPTFLPQEWTLSNFERILTDPDLPLSTYYMNSLFIAGVNVFATLVTSSILGYIFAKYRFRGRQPLFWYLMAVMTIPPTVTMIPLYLLLSEMKLLNNHWGLIVTALISPFGVFLMRQFMMSVSDDEIEAARLDGASEFRVFWSVVLPSVKPALATIGLITFMSNWNAYLWPLIVLTGNDKRTIPVILTWFSTQHSSQLNLVMAASVLMVIPVLLVFLLAQKWIVAGLTLTGGK